MKIFLAEITGRSIEIEKEKSQQLLFFDNEEISLHTIKCCFPSTANYDTWFKLAALESRSLHKHKFI